MARLKDFYYHNVIPQLKTKLNISNIMAIPKVSKVTLNMGVGKAVRDKKEIQYAVEDLEKISGQKPIVTNTRKSIAGFKIRAGWPIGCKVTLRKNRMYEFLDRLISITIPRIRDFRGFSTRSFDGYGNYNIGIKEQISFPEIDYDKVNSIRGLDISIMTTSKNNTEGEALLRALKFPLKNI